MIRKSGENWYLEAWTSVPTIAVIEAPKESYNEFHERKKAEEGARKVPFGFARALAEEPSE